MKHKPVVFDKEQQKLLLDEQEMQDLLALLEFVLEHKESIIDNVHRHSDEDTNFNEVDDLLDKVLPRFIDKFTDIKISNVTRELRSKIMRHCHDMDCEQIKKVLNQITETL